MKTNYIVAFYGGERRNHPNPPPLSFFVKKHIEFLQSHPFGISHATFVFNTSPHPQESILVDYLSNIQLPIPHHVFVRNNKNLSYGAWDDALKLSLISPTFNLTKDIGLISNVGKECDYSFLIEDDYIPSDKNFLKYFKSKVTEKTIFVASYYSPTGAFPPHAAISNGLLVNTHVDKNNPFYLPPPKDSLNHNYNVDLQVQFLSKYDDFEKCDITDIAHTIYMDPNGNKIYGDEKKLCLIHPIND